MRVRVLLAPILVLCVASSALAWGPQAHAFLGRFGARQAGFDDRGAELAASGALLADLDHSLKNPAPIGDTVAFSRAIAGIRGSSAHSDRFAAGWLAHALAQDPGQGEISSQSLKLHADLILGRTRGFQIAGAVFDPDRIRRAVTALGKKAPSADAIRKAVEHYLLLGILEGALVDMVPLALGDAPAASAGTARQERTPEFDLAPVAAAGPSAAPTALPSARSLMPAALANYERRLEESLTATAKILAAPLPDAPKPAAGAAPGAGAGAVSRMKLPPARLIGIAMSTRPIADGLQRTTASLYSRRLFGAAAGLMLVEMAKDQFPSVYKKWDARARTDATTRQLQQYLREEGARLRRLFP